MAKTIQVQIIPSGSLLCPECRIAMVADRDPVTNEITFECSTPGCPLDGKRFKAPLMTLEMVEDDNSGG